MANECFQALLNEANIVVLGPLIDTNAARTAPRALMLAILKIYVIFISLTTQELEENLQTRLVNAQTATLSEFFTECYSIKHIILENLGDFSNRFIQLTARLSKLEHDCLWHLGKELAEQLNESKQMQMDQRTQLACSEHSPAEFQEEQNNSGKKRTRPWSPRLHGGSDDQVKRNKPEDNEQNKSESPRY